MNVRLNVLNSFKLNQDLWVVLKSGLRLILIFHSNDPLKPELYSLAAGLIRQQPLLGSTEEEHRLRLHRLRGLRDRPLLGGHVLLLLLLRRVPLHGRARLRQARQLTRTAHRGREVPQRQRS